MSGGKLSQEQQYQNMKRETEVIGQAHDLLMTGRFPGGAALTLATCQAYLKGLFEHMSKECDKLAPLEIKPVESNARPLGTYSIGGPQVQP